MERQNADEWYIVVIWCIWHKNVRWRVSQKKTTISFLTFGPFCYFGHLLTILDTIHRFGLLWTLWSVGTLLDAFRQFYCCFFFGTPCIQRWCTRPLPLQYQSTGWLEPGGTTTLLSPQSWTRSPVSYHYLSWGGLTHLILVTLADCKIPEHFWTGWGHMFKTLTLIEQWLFRPGDKLKLSWASSPILEMRAIQNTGSM